MSGTTAILGSVGESSGAMLALAQWHAASPARRIVAAEQLMASPCGVVLPRLDEIPVEHRFLADDREAIALAEILVSWWPPSAIRSRDCGLFQIKRPQPRS